MAESFVVESMIRGYHEYKSIWENPVVGEQLNCIREVGNSHDPMAVAVIKEIEGETKTVGHIPRRISALSSVFIRGGTIRCIVNRNRRYSADLIQGGLEIPCLLIFGSKSSLKLRVQPVDDIPEILQDCSSSPTNHKTVIQNVIPVCLSILKRKTNRVCVDAADLPQMPVDLTASEGCSPPKKKQKCFDIERIFLECELPDIEVNYAQHLIKLQFIHYYRKNCLLVHQK